jgi:hypothetical protein
MTIFEDTRNPVSKHKNIHDYCDANKIKIERTKLFVGDYTLPTNQTICIDTKQDLQEVYGNVIQDHVRFKAEILRAKAAGIRLIILVEQEGIKSLSDVPNWKNPRVLKWHKIHNAHKAGKMLNIKINNSPPASSLKLAMSMTSMQNKYGVEWQFCDKSETGKRIVEILGGKRE